MRIFLLAVLTAVLLMPQSADAARRDERSTQATSRAQPGQVVRPAARQTPQAAASRQAAARQAPRLAASRPAAARQAPGAAAGRRAASRQAALRPGDVRTQRQGVVVRGAAAATLPRGPATASRKAARTASRSNATCTRRNGRTTCAPTERVVTEPPLSWQAGLPSASNTQRDCPAGTLATLARGHNDIVRCMPL